MTAAQLAFDEVGAGERVPRVIVEGYRRTRVTMRAERTGPFLFDAVCLPAQSAAMLPIK